MRRVLTTLAAVLFATTAHAQIVKDSLSSIAGGPGAPHVATNAALAAASTATYPNGVWRDDYAAGNGAPPLFFVAQTGTCVANSMVNDGGSCVNSSNSNSWKAVPPASGVSALEFGAIGDGVTDDTTAMQAAINASSQKALLLGPHLYAISSTGLTCNNPIKMIGNEAGNQGGTGLQFSGFVPLATNQTLFTLQGGCWGSIFSDFAVYMAKAGANTSGWVFAESASQSFVTFQRLTFDGACGGIDLSGDYWAIDGLMLTNMTGNSCQGIRLGHLTTAGGTTGILTNTNILSVNSASRLGVGVQIEDCGGCWFSNNDIIHSNVGTLVEPGLGGANQQAINLFFSNTVLGDTTNSIAFQVDTGAASGIVKSIQCNGCWASSSQTNYGISISNTSAGTVAGLHFVGARVYSNSQHGVLVNAGTDIDIDSSSICGNNVSAGSNTGIAIASGVNNVRIHGGSVGGSCDGKATTQNIGIYFVGTSTGVLVQGVNVSQGNTTAISYGAGVSGRIEGNPGFNPAGASNVTVTASPFSHTAGPTSEYVCIVGGTVSDVSIGGVQFANATNTCAMVAPGQTEVVTYTVAPTMNISKQ